MYVYMPYICIYALYMYVNVVATMRATIEHQQFLIITDPPSQQCSRVNRSLPSKKIPGFKLCICINSGWKPPWVKGSISAATHHHTQSYPIGRLTTSRQRGPCWNDGEHEVVQKLCKEGRLKDALHLIENMIQQTPTKRLQMSAYICLLKACAERKALAEGKQVHVLMVRSKCDSDIFLANNLIDMYSKCGSVVDARVVFDMMPEHDVFSWTTIISAYAKCGCLEDARKLFDNMSERNVVSWNAMIAGYAQNGLGKEALALYEQMKQEGMPANKITLVCVLKACASIGALEQGKLIHSLILKKGFNLDVIVQNSLIDMYAKCGCLQDARELFNCMTERDVCSWNTIIAGYTQNGYGKEALALYEQMKQDKVQANKITLVSVLKACTNTGSLDRGKLIHSLILERGFDLDVIVESTLVDMYAKCGCLEDARELFNNMSQKNVVSWTAMIAGYAQNGLGNEALALYEEMKQKGVQANKVTLVSVLKACTNTGALEQGKVIHSLILDKGFDQDLIVQSTLVDMYAKCGCLENACELFNNMNKRDVVSWNALIGGYAQNGLGKEALALYEQMKQEGMQEDKITFVCVLKACTNIGALERGELIHSLILEKGFDQDLIVQSTLLDMYAKCGCLEKARELFNNMNKRDVVSWSALIAGYAQNGLGKEALSLYEQMKQEGIQANKITFICVLKACANLGALDQGKLIHSLILEKGFDRDVLVQNTLVDMYAKCGCLEDARELFNKMNGRSLASWNAMIGGCAQNGLGKEALSLYEQMKQEGIQPDDVTYTCVLSACSHSGLIEEGFCVFDFMYKHTGRIPALEHYACMVDLLGRAGLLAEAEDFIMKMPIQPDSVVWMSLLGTARGAGNAEIGQHAYNFILNLKTKNIAPYLLSRDIHTAADRMDNMER